MAFQTGSQINPALGAINYTPYLQGSVAGSQAIGQGIASLGQSIAGGIEQYTKQKKENKAMEAQLKANINALEGIGTLAKNMAPEAQQVFSSTMSKLNDPSTPLTEKLALSESAQKTVGELLNFGIQAKQKQDQAMTQQLAYEAAVSGQGVPMIYPQNVRAPASIMSLDLMEKMANIEAAKAPKPQAISYATEKEARAAGEMANPGMVVKVEPGSKGGWTFSASQKPVEQVANPYETKIADQLIALDTAAKAAPEQLARIDAQVAMLNEGNVNVGFLQNVKQGFSQILGALGDKNEAKKVDNTQILESSLGADLLSQIKAAGLTTKSFDTPKEMENLRKALTGSTELTPEALKHIAELRRKNVLALVEDYNKKVEAGAFNRMYSLYGQQPKKIEIGEKKPAAGGGTKTISVDY